MLAVTNQSLDKMLTADDVAMTLGISKQALLKKKGIENFISNKYSFGGRPRAFFHPEVFSWLGIEKPEEKELRVRKIRTDINSSRVCSEEMEMAVVNLAFEIYLSQANRNYILNSVQRACIELWNDKYAAIFESASKMTEYFYKRRIKGKSKAFIGYADRYPTWQTQWEREYKKHNTANIRTPTKQFKLLDLFESYKIIGPGYGAATFWVIDDHKSDSFIYFNDPEKSYKGKQPNAIYLMDAVSGKFLDYIVGEPSSLSVATLIIRNVLKYGLPHAIGLENARAMKNLRLDSMICSLYSDEKLKWYKEDSGDWFHEAFPKRTIPIIRNIPHIPRSILKARQERMFQEVKSHDGEFFPETYQGGGIDPVQLRVSTTPKQPLQLYSEYNYFTSLQKYLDTVYCDKIRTKMFDNFFTKTGRTPTIANVWDYYGGNTRPGTGVEIDDMKFALALYWLSQLDDTSGIVTRKSKALQGGRLRCQVEGRDYVFTNHLLARYEGEKLHILFIPSSFGDKYADVDTVAIYADKQNGVEFICIAEDIMVRDSASLQRATEQVAETRKIMKAIETPYEVVMNKPVDYAKELKATMEQAPLLPKPEVKKLEEPKIADDLLDLINL